MIVPIQLDGNRDYNIHIGPLQNLEDLTKVLVVTNPKIGGLHLSYLLEKINAKEVYVHTVPDGEQFKSMETIEGILGAAFEHRLDRRSVMIALGGGVIGDMVGFASGIYQRGISFIQVPTTLLSQVDASVGGKTGVNNAYGKNLVGLFHQPLSVNIDTHFLQTLPKREFGAGVAEIVKMAVTFDKTFFEWLESHPLSDDENLQYAIMRSVEIKAEVVAQDEREKGIRAALNYGHTFAHVVENETGYSEYLHGEAVAMGIVMANDLAVRLGNMTHEEGKRVLRLLEEYDLPTFYPVQNALRFYDKFFLDKKSMDSVLTFVLPKGIGDVELRSDLEKEDILLTLETFKSTSGATGY